MTRELAVMQGRLSPPVGDLIQAFPALAWQSEFASARRAGVQALEWTVDLVDVRHHPLLDAGALDEVRRLLEREGIATPSVTCDFFMQADIYRGSEVEFDVVRQILLDIAQSPVLPVGAILVVPLVDGGRPRTAEQWRQAVDLFAAIDDDLRTAGCRIGFELDVEPGEQRRFIEQLSGDTFGINFDMGNSAAQGFRPRDELERIGDRVIHVHIKDRLLGGTTVPLGTGSTDFAGVAEMLERMDYSGILTLQGARVPGVPEWETVRRYADLCRFWGLV